MATNFLRTCSLSLTGGSSRVIKGGGSTDLDIVFNIKATTLQAPNVGSFRVFNPSQATIAQFKDKEFKTVQFSAGYEDHNGPIYTGDIMQSRSGKEDAVNGYLDIFCSDAGNAYQQARVTKTLAAGYTPRDRLQVALDALAPFGITLRTVNVDLSTPEISQGRRHRRHGPGRGSLRRPLGRRRVVDPGWEAPRRHRSQKADDRARSLEAQLHLGHDRRA